MSAPEELFALHCRALDIQPVREFRFATPRRWRFDFAWPDQRVALEIEGGAWSGGRHVTGAGFEADCEKYNQAALLGWIVLRVTPRHVTNGDALMMAQAALAAR